MILGAAFDGDGVGASAFTWTLMQAMVALTCLVGKAGPAAWSAVKLLYLESGSIIRRPS